MKIKCPNCNREVILDKTKFKYHKRGRIIDCPSCKKGIVMSRFVRTA